MTSSPDAYTTRELSIPQTDPKRAAIATSIFTPDNANKDSQDVTLIFSHGAGGDMSSDAVANFRDGFAPLRTIATFNGNMNLKSRVSMFKTVAATLEDKRRTTIFGGRSMGARAAILAAGEMAEDIGKLLVLVSYPLHTDKEVRDQLLLDLDESWEILFISGDHDSMCELRRLDAVRKKMKARSWLVVVEGANHGMTVKPNAGTREVGMMTGRVATGWAGDRDGTGTEGRISWSDDKEAIWSGWSNEQANERPTAAIESESQTKAHDKTATPKSAGPSKKRERSEKTAQPKKAAKKIVQQPAASQNPASTHDTTSRATRSSTRLKARAMRD